ncbi:hypothetical protein ACS0TY_020913 [Phlomoides rotata]
MESIVLQPLLQVVFEKLSEEAIQNFSSLINLKKDTKKLKDQLVLIQSVIQDAEERQVREESIRFWLSKLQSIAYDADDLLDRINTEQLRRESRERLRGVKMGRVAHSKVPFLSYFIQSIDFSHLIPNFDSLSTSRELKDIQRTIGGLTSEIPLLRLRNEVRYRRYETSERPQTGISVNASQVFGRDEDVKMIVKMLMPLPSHDGRSNNTVSVIPIVGMGGIGKTTLAQLVYDNPDIEKHFELRIWIAVRDNFNVRKLIRDILEYTGQKDSYGSQLPQLGILQSRLQESVSKKRYFLVLDDVWNEDEAEWSKLREPLSYGIGGSKIVVTTRNQTVANLMGTYASYALKPLADDSCWSLFRQLVFPNGGEEDHPILTNIGKNIVKKCGGVPLAAKVLGSLLRAHRDEREWQNVLSSEIWDLRDSSILSALRLTYNHLPPNQKRCFLFCSVYPKNYDINREKLIHQWIAEGLIPSPGDGNSSRNMEDVANEYFNDLVWMSLFEGVSNSEDGRIAEFRVHNLIHDLALSVYRKVPEKSSHEEVFVCEAERRAYVVCNELSPATSNRLCPEKLRTLQLMCLGNDSTEVICSLFKRLRRLRVLNLSNCGITVVHKSIGGLIYLRSLDLSNNLMSTLPETICNLLNLQSLNLSSCRALEELPNKITNLTTLRHLNIEDCVSLCSMPPNIEKLKNLQTLPIFIVGLSPEENLLQLRNLSLRGELKIRHLENVIIRDFVGAQKPELLVGNHLHTLSLSWGDDNEEKVGHNAPRQNAQQNHELSAESLLNLFFSISLEFRWDRAGHSNFNLRELQIYGYTGNGFPEGIYDLALPYLRKLVLVNCRKCETLPTLGQLKFLKYLQMQGMDEVVKIADEFYGRSNTQPFSSLSELIIEDFPNLRSWESVGSLEAFPWLQKILVIKCPRLTSMPRFPSLQHLEMHKCNDMLLRSASGTNSLSTLVMNDCSEAHFIPKPLFLNNPRLKSLKISSCPKLASLPPSIGALTALESLSISHCEELKSLPREMVGLTSLQTLEIIQCSGLISLPDESMQGLVSLRSLSIENCSSLCSLPHTMQNLAALEHLTVMYCPNLVHLHVMQEFRALQSLNILSCASFKSLPRGLEDALSLLNLEIHGCPELQELPGWIGNIGSLRSLTISECKNIKFLPDGVQRLKELQYISIIGCPDLQVRCREGTGEDWDKISHVPFKRVGTSQQGDPSASTSSV